MEYNMLLVVNEKDEITGYGEKIDIHKKGILHRAFSVFLVDEKGNILIQKRAEGKYHSGGVWSNSCCSHQYKGEEFKDSVKRCIYTELGIDVNLDGENFKRAGKFIYDVNLGEMNEHEIDHVVVIKIPGDTLFDLNKDEVSSVRWLSTDEIDKELKEGVNYSAWFEKAYGKAKKY